TLLKYLQRYHARNESVGFFGPVAWGRIGDGPGRITVRTAARTVGRKRVYVEDWAVEVLARAFAADSQLADRLPPARAFGVVRLGRALVHPGGGLTRLSVEQAEAVALVDGRRTFAGLATALGTTADDVHRRLAPLLTAGLLTRGFEVPPELDAERALARQLRTLPPTAATARCLAVLDDLDKARAAAERASSAAELAAALDSWDARFVQATGAPAGRSRDESPTGRRSLVMQAERNVAVELGSRLVADLAPPLELLLTSARWLARRAGDELETVAGKLHQELAPIYPDGEVPFHALVSRLAPVTQSGEWLDPLVAELTDRWTGILAPDFAAGRVARSSAELAPAVQAAFGGPAPGYAAGRHHSPDVMIAAAGPEAIEAGDFTFVLGELHVAMVTMDSRSFTDCAPDPGRPTRLATAGLTAGQPRFVPLHVRGVDASISGWDHPAPDAYVPAYTYLSFGERIGERDVPKKVRAAEVTVGEHGGALLARLPDGTRHPALHLLGEYAAWALVSRFRLLPPRPHTPRVTVDRLVVARETWRIPSAELAPLTRLPEADGYAELRRLAARHGLARHTFWRPARDAKPIYLDLDSPLLGMVALREARRSTESVEAIAFTEMYPGPGELWLPDADGRRYPSELRLTFADTTTPEQR
ncbi:lantibiotic dehydratase, partial [Lysinibacillus sp. NPDC056185]|uniref:lantibiotic dehydratase n=1 Tax=Lysinibacillus sp. NPDC056185 TaxID=3345739 RepID=UPI0039EFC0A2